MSETTTEDQDFTPDPGETPAEDERGTETTRTPEEEAEAEEPAEDEAEGEQDDAPTAKLRAEAQKYRQRLRDTETERDQLSEQLAAARSEIVQAAMSEHVSNRTLLEVEDVFMFTETTPADFLTEDGTTDKAKIEAAVQQVLKARPHLGRPAPKFDSARGKAQGKPRPSFEDAFKS